MKMAWIRTPGSDGWVTNCFACLVEIEQTHYDPWLFTDDGIPHGPICRCCAKDPDRLQSKIADQYRHYNHQGEYEAADLWEELLTEVVP